MADGESTTYRAKLHQIYEVPKYDELVQGPVTRDYIKADFGEKEPSRGMLLMLSGNNFVPATKDGIANASELAICSTEFYSTTISTDEGDLVLIWGYFSGTFKGTSIILPYETEEDNHTELLEEIRAKLRTQNIHLV